MMTETPFTVSDDNHTLETRVSFNADEPLTLSASNASGNVAVRSDASLPAGMIQVAATRTDHGTFEDDDRHFTVKTEGNTISVHPDWQFASGVSGIARRIRDQLQHGFRPEDWNLSRLRFSPELDFHITITLPRSLAPGSQVKIRTASGEVEASDLVASTSIVTASGDVTSRTIAGTVTIHTASGDVAATDTTESLEINTASGDITIMGGDTWLAARSASGDVRIRDIALRNARVTTVSGDVAINAALANTAAPYNVETVSGDIRLESTLPGSGVTAVLGFGTLSGSSKVGSGWDKQKRREWRAGSGDRTVSINVKTVSGDLIASARLSPDVDSREVELPQHTAGEESSAQDFKDEMRAFGQEMKEFGREMKRSGEAGVTPPVPPTPPSPPSRARGGDHLFTVGPSGRPYRQTEDDASQPTEPVSPPEPFTGEDKASAGEQDEGGTTAPIEMPAPEQDERLRLLEAVERGEMDIEDALAQLGADPDGAHDQR
jgi:hypothetical protein